MAHEPQESELVERLDALEPSHRQLVVELAASLAVVSSDQAGQQPDQDIFEPIMAAPSTRLIERLQQRLGEASVKIVDSPEAPTSTGSVDRRAQVAPLAETSRFFRHYHTPPNMRNFLSMAMPTGLSERAFDLPPRQASLLSYALITVYKNNPRYGERRQTTVEILERYVGLYDRAQEPAEIDRAKARTPTQSVMAIQRAQESIEKELSWHAAEQFYNLAVDEDEASIEASVASYLDQRRKVLRPEDEPVPDGFDRQILRDSSGTKHVILWNEETLEIIIDGKSHEAPRKTNLYRDRIALLRCLTKRRKEAFLSSHLHKYGVGKGGKQTDGAVKQAINQALKAVEELTIETPNGPVPILGYASPRKYQLHPELGGPAIKSKVAKPRKKQVSKPTDKQTTGVDRTAELSLQGNMIHIHGKGYEIYGHEERAHLRAILESPRLLDAREIAIIVHRTQAPSDRSIEATEEVFFELTKRGIVLESHKGSPEAYYEINTDIESTRQASTVVEIQGDILYFDEFDLQILREFILSGRPLAVKQVASRINPERMEQADYDILARTIKKYLYPHGIVERERLPEAEGGQTTNRFSMPPEIKDIVSAELPNLI